MSSADFVIPFGHHKGERVGDVADPELRSLRDWCAERDAFPDLVDAIEEVLDDRQGLPLELGEAMQRRRRGGR